MVVNTGRGALIDTIDVIEALKSRHVGSLALDVYEEEAELFFEDRSADVITADVFARLTTFPNVLVTAHQAFLTHEALDAIATTTLRTRPTSRPDGPARTRGDSPLDRMKWRSSVSAGRATKDPDPRHFQHELAGCLVGQQETDRRDAAGIHRALSPQDLAE
jgi:hypothetical protein